MIHQSICQIFLVLLNIFLHFRHDFLSSGSFASFERPPASISYRPPYCLLGARGVTRHIWSHCYPLAPAINRCHLLSSVIPCRHPLLSVVTRYYPLSPVTTRCHPSSPVITPRHPLPLVVTHYNQSSPVFTCRHRLYFVVIRCHLLSSVTTRCHPPLTLVDTHRHPLPPVVTRRHLFILIYRPPYCLLGARNLWGNTPYLVPLSSVVTRYQPLSPVVLCYTPSSPFTTRCHPLLPVVTRRHQLYFVVI